MNNRLKIEAIDFFCGAGGMSYGLSKAGIRVLAGIDNDPQCTETYTHNNKSAQFINYDINSIMPSELSDILGVKQNNDYLVMAGCSPCQYWSKIYTDKTKSRQTAFLLNGFQKFVDWFNPGFVVIENVPGIFAKKSHSLLLKFCNFLKSKDYIYADGVINSFLYGVPQNRKRYLLIATRLFDKIELPKGRKNKRLIVRNFIGAENGFPKIEAGHKDASDFIHTSSNLSPKNMCRISLTPPNGGDRSSWKDDPELQIKAYEGKDHIFKDVYGRMYWDRPAPTITTRFNSVSNGRFGHPEENRAISLREGATLQTFPKKYVFKGPNQAAIARQIGNAVPPKLAKQIGKTIVNYYFNKNR